MRDIESEMTKAEAYNRYQQAVYSKMSKERKEQKGLRNVSTDAFVWLLLFAVVGAGVLGYIVTTFSVVAR